MNTPSSKQPIDSNTLYQTPINGTHQNTIEISQQHTIANNQQYTLPAPPINENIHTVASIPVYIFVTLSDQTSRSDLITLPEIEPISIHHTGYKITSIDLDIEWTNTVLEHGTKCHECKLNVISSTKNGYEMIDVYECNWCRDKLVKRGSIDANMGSSKRKHADINMSMAVGTYVAGVSVSKMNEVGYEVGLISPMVTNM